MVQFTEFTRHTHREDEEGLPVDLPISVNPNYVAAVFEDQEPGNCIIRVANGQGFKVRGTYAEVVAKLRNGSALQ
jgi:hypothetical protein